MHNHSDQFPDVPSRIERLGCYSGLYSTEARVFYPETVDHVREVFQFAKENGCRVTIRGGAHAFDAQSLGDDLVISMMGFKQIEVDVGARRLRVGPGRTWGEIVAALAPVGLMPAVTVTTSHATAGGTLAGDCLSRFSPAYGKEGTKVKSFDMVTPEGNLLVCTPPDSGVPPAQWTPEEHAFSGVIGGLGYLGAVTAITYEVLRVNKPGPIRIATSVTRCPTFEKLVEELVPIAHQTDLDPSDPNNYELPDSIYAGLHAGRFGGQSALLFTSRVDPGRERRRLLLHRPRLWLRVPAEWILRSWVGEWALWRLFYGLVNTKKDYVDDLADYTFFMDGNVRAKHAGKKLFRRKMQTIQQTFVVPGDAKDESTWSDTQNNLLEWLRYAHGVLRGRKVAPTMHDVMYLPADDRFPLSATAELAGFAVSYAFETSSKRKLRKIKASFEEMSAHLWQSFQGRVYLVKNVHADPQVLRDMYYPHAIRFFTVKHQLDPHCILRNEFLDRTFEALLQCTPLPTPPAQVGRPAAAQPTA